MFPADQMEFFVPIVFIVIGVAGVLVLISLLRAAFGAQDIRKRREFELSGRADKINQGCAIVVLIALAVAAFVYFLSR